MTKKQKKNEKRNGLSFFPDAKHDKQRTNEKKIRKNEAKDLTIFCFLFRSWFRLNTG